MHRQRFARIHITPPAHGTIAVLFAAAFFHLRTQRRLHGAPTFILAWSASGSIQGLATILYRFVAPRTRGQKPGKRASQGRAPCKRRARDPLCEFQGVLSLFHYLEMIALLSQNFDIQRWFHPQCCNIVQRFSATLRPRSEYKSAARQRKKVIKISTARMPLHVCQFRSAVVALANVRRGDSSTEMWLSSSTVNKCSFMILSICGGF